MRKLICLLLCCCSCFYADTVVMQDGSRIQGKLEKIKGEQVFFKTGFAGVLTIDRKKVVSLKTEEAGYFVMQDEAEKQKPQIQSRLLDLKGDEVTKIAALWREEQDNPYRVIPRKWTGDCYLDISGKKGNTDKFNRNIGATAYNKGQYDQLKLYFVTCYSEENDVKSDDDMTLGVDYEYARQKHSWYSRLEYEEDEMSDLAHRYQGATGYGFYFWKNDKSLFRLRCGLDFTREEWDYDNKKEDNLGLDSNLLFRYQFKDLGKWETSLTYNPAFNDWLNDYRILHESFWELPIHLRIPLSLRLGLSHEYYGLTVGDVKHCDTTYFARLVYKW